MTIDTFDCPSCGVHLRRSPALAVGMQVRCPRCSYQFAVPPEEKVPQPPPSPPGEERSRWSREENREERPRRRDRYDDEEDEEDDHRRRPHLEDLRPRRYVIDLGDWFTHAGRHWGDFLGPSIAYQFLLATIAVFLCLVTLPLMIIPGVGPIMAGVVLTLVIAPLSIGWHIVSLRILKDQDWEFGHFFSGFKYFGNLLGYSLLRGLINLVLVIPVILIAVAGRMQGGREAALLILPVQLIAIAAAIFIELRLGIFAIFLIVDRRFGPVDAMIGTWRLTDGHFFGLLGVTILLTLIMMAGIATCGIGILFVWPLVILVLTAGYLRAVGFDLDYERSARRSSRGRRYDEGEEENADRIRPSGLPQYDQDDEEIRRRAPRIDPEQFRRTGDEY